MNAKQFAQEVGISQGTLSNILGGRNKPSLDVMQAVLNRFRQVRSDWLILGSGVMYERTGQEPAAREPIASENTANEENTPRRFVMGSLFPETEPAENRPSDPEETAAAPERIRETAPERRGGRGIRNQPAVQEPRRTRQLVRVVLMYDDGTYEER